MSELEKFAKQGGGYPGQCLRYLNPGIPDNTGIPPAYLRHCIVLYYIIIVLLLYYIRAEGNDTMCNL